MVKKYNILSAPNLKALEGAFTELGLKKFRAKQVWQWIYCYGLTNFNDMTNINKDIRKLLSENFYISRPKVINDLISNDGTRKWLFEFTDGNQVETVYIPEEDRGTLCISSQVGCTLTCKFCHTGTQMLVRNLTSAEILEQILMAKDMLKDYPSTRPERKISNIVLMGMGEPLFNYDNVAIAMKIVMEGNGLGISRRRITLSTSGVVPLIEKCGEELRINLAISLHSTNNEQRNKMMPINKKYPLNELLKACENYPAANANRRITFEYVMLDGVNDSIDDAHKLVDILTNIHAKINLIPFNVWEGAGYKCSSNNRMHAFARVLVEAGYPSPIRKTRGEDIMAACGQLKSESMRAKKI